MAAAEDNETVFHRYTDDASAIALLRCLRAGAAAVDFVHHVDVCSAAPEDLVANLEPHRLLVFLLSQEVQERPRQGLRP
ncbi:unnamed protein product [Urochloa humidicola]